jgi:flavin-dependent dehydrogenase
MRRVAIVGGGPAGAFAAERLAAAGLDILLFDEKLAWEKPCGGGLTRKAYKRYPFLLDNGTPKKLVHEMVFAAPSGEVRLCTGEPLVI